MTRQGLVDELTLEALDRLLLASRKEPGGSAAPSDDMPHTGAGRSASAISEPDASATACSIACSSSRTFPFHSCAQSAR